MEDMSFFGIWRYEIYVQPVLLGFAHSFTSEVPGCSRRLRLQLALGRPAAAGDLERHLPAAGRVPSDRDVGEWLGRLSAFRGDTKRTAVTTPQLCPKGSGSDKACLATTSGGK